jgi:glucosylceramidase
VSTLNIGVKTTTFFISLNMKYKLIGGISMLTIILIAAGCNTKTVQSPSLRVWITTADQSQLLTEVTNLTFSKEPAAAAVIEIDSTTTYQTMAGFGYALTGGSAMLLQTKLTAAARTNLLRELFLREEGIGISYLRISIGASDLDEYVFSYDDMPTGKTDPALSKFNLAYDTLYLIPVLKEILALNPAITIMGSPWSPPAWMKTNLHLKGGSLKPEYYGVYANYFVKYIQAMARQGIPIDAITIQNEPENPNNTPSLLMTAAEQNEFIKKYLGPAFKAAEIKTKIILFDHNCDHPEYPIAILDDPETKPFVDGSAFHMYLGEITALAKVHDAHPDKNLYFTEQWTWSKGKFDGDLRWHVKNLIVGATRNWSRNVLEWNLASDENFDPHTNDGGCDSCQGALTIGDSVSRNVSYYIIAHASKFVPPGSVRIASTLVDELPNVTFLTPEGKKVVIVLNDSEKDKLFSVKDKNKLFTTTLPAGAVGTYVWN